MISILVLYLTFGVFSNALIYPTNQSTHSGGFAVRSNQQNDVMTSECTQLYSKASEGLPEKHKCIKINQTIVVGFADTLSECQKHCCYLKDLKDRLETEINRNNECLKTDILGEIVDINFLLMISECESIGCKCYQKFVETFESNHKRVSNKNCPTGECDEKSICCTILEGNQGFKDEMINANECESKVREEMIKQMDAYIYSATRDLCPDCSFKVEKSNDLLVIYECFGRMKFIEIQIKTEMSTKMKCGDVCSDSLKCCVLYEAYKEIESQYKSKPIENCGQKQMDLFRTLWSENKGFLLKHCSHCSSDKSPNTSPETNVGSSVGSITRWYHSIGLVSIALTLIHHIFKL